MNSSDGMLLHSHGFGDDLILMEDGPDAHTPRRYLRVAPWPFSSHMYVCSPVWLSFARTRGHRIEPISSVLSLVVPVDVRAGGRKL